MGTEEFWIPAAVAALGSGAEYVNQSQANKRQDAGEAQAILDQQHLQQKAAGDVNKTIQGIQSSDPSKIANTATGQYVAQLRKNAAGVATGGSTSSLAPAVGASSRYKGDVTNAQTSLNNYGGNIASEMGDIDAATRQRQNEGLSMEDLGSKLNTLGAQSYSTNFVDQLRANAAGQANPWVSLFSGMLKNGAAAYASGAGGKSAKLGRTAFGNAGLDGTLPASTYSFLGNPGGSLNA